MNSEHLHVLLDETHKAARRLHRRLGGPLADRQDIEQDLLVDLLRRMPAYSPARGGLGPFAGTVLRRHSSRLASRSIAARHRTGGAIISIDAVDRRALTERVAETEGLWQKPSAVECADVRMNLADIIGHLDQNERALCTDLASKTVSELVSTGRYSRSTLYRRIARLRLTFTAWGLSPEVRS